MGKLNRNQLFVLLAVIMVFTAGKVTAHPQKPVVPLCTFLSVTHPPDEISYEKRVYNPGLVNWSRDYPMGAGSAPSIVSIQTFRDYPFPNELIRVQIEGYTPKDYGDGLATGAMKLHWAEIGYTFTSGTAWYFNNSPTGNPGIAMDYFSREVLNAVNVGSSKWKSYQGETGSWAVSTAYTPAQTDPPAPNRRGVMPAGLAAFTYEFPYDYPCPYGENCPLWNQWAVNNLGDGVDFLASTFPNADASANCNKAPYDAVTGESGVNNCNVPGFPEGGGDLLDNFPAYDPDPANYPNVPGDPIIRVNGVPGISCNIYNGTDGKPMHPLCEEFVDENILAIYDGLGIYGYTLNPIAGKVVFNHKLTSKAVVDAVFYTNDRKFWTGIIDLTQEPFNSAVNMAGRSFHVQTRLYDTCGNMATGTNSPPTPSFNPTNNEQIAYVGLEDYHWDMVPTDQDATVQMASDKDNTFCGGVAGATEDYCPTEYGAEWNFLTDFPADCENGKPGCECCYNQCRPTTCDFNGGYYAMCHNFADAGNPPGCGPEFDGNNWGAANQGMSEIHNVKVSHTEANLYLKMEVKGEVIFGCYGSWYPIIGCEQWDFGDQGSKFNGYTFRVTNQQGLGSAFFVVIVPDIPIYGEISLFLDLETLKSGGFASTYKDCSLQAYADGEGACNFCSEEGASTDPCEDLGCDPEEDEGGDCDGDTYPNNIDPCPCEDGGEDTTDGCPVEDPGGDDGFDAYMCNACGVEKQNNKLYIELGIDGQIESSGEAPYEILGMMLGLHNFEICELLEAACWKSFSFASLALDTAPRINYYRMGDVSRKSIAIRQDTVPPTAPEIEACLGRCEEAVLRDPVTDPGIGDGDDDADPVAFEPLAENRINEGYNPTATEIEIRFPEIVFNDDPYHSYLRDLGGYKLYVSRGQDLTFQHYYTWCDEAASADCQLSSGVAMSPRIPNSSPTLYVERDTPAMDEPYSPLGGQRFPIPHDETSSLDGWNFPREPVSCIIEHDCDIPGNTIDEDKDGAIDDGCYATNCYDDDSVADPTITLKEDGQTYNFKALSYDANGNVSQWSNQVTVTILRNTTAPAQPNMRNVYAMAQGRTTKIAWDLNPETDIGAYAVYRCPARPIDAVILTESGQLEDYCTGPGSEAHYRMVHKELLHQLKNHVLDDGLGFYEGGIGASLGAGNLISDHPAGFTLDDTTACDTHGYLAGDDDCDAIDDDTDGVLKPTETNAYEYIDCSDFDVRDPDVSNADLMFCGNMDPSWRPGQPVDLYDAADTDRPVLFPVGLVDGYDYYYRVKAIDHPYSGDGFNDPGTCNQGTNPWTRDPATFTSSGCVNPIEDTDGLAPDLGGRNCDDPMIQFDWEDGGNCSVFSEYESGKPADTKPPLAASNLVADGAADGSSADITWSVSTSDITLKHFQLYRSNAETGPFACVHGGCDTPPYIDGCECDPTIAADLQCNDGRSCAMPVKICTDANFTTKAQINGCTTAPYSDGCECTSDADCRQDTCVELSGGVKQCSISKVSCNTAADCTESRVCSYGKYVCMSSDPMEVNDGIDNDGDGVIDEDVAGDGLDNDNDGLIDEDVGQQEVVTLPDGSIKYVYDVGKCPTPDYDPATPLTYTMHELPYATATSITATDGGLTSGVTYFFKVAGVDNAVYDPEDDDAIYNVHPPNVGAKSVSVAVAPQDDTAPGTPSEACAATFSDGLDHEDYGCCWNAANSVYTPCAVIDTEDIVGKRLTVKWMRNTDADVVGYYVFRAEDTAGTGEPSSSQYVNITTTYVSQPASGNMVYYRDSGLENGAHYYYMVQAMDARYNKSGYSEVVGPAEPADTWPPSTPKWSPVYRKPNIGCDSATIPSDDGCNTEQAEDCNDGGLLTDGSGNTVILQWAPYYQTVCVTNSEKESDFHHYNVYRSNESASCNVSVVECTTSSNEPCVAGTDITTTFYRHDSDVLAGEKYYYCLTAVDENGNESAPLTAKSITPNDVVPPLKPTGLSATPMSSSRIGLGWNQNPETDMDSGGYRIYRSETGVEGSFLPMELSGDNVISVDPDGTPDSGDEMDLVNGALIYIDTGLTPDETFYYKIAAVDNTYNEGPKSNSASAKTTTTDSTAPARPENLDIRNGFDMGETVTNNDVDDEPESLGGPDGYIDDKNLKAGQIEIYWDRVTTADIAQYKIYRLDPPVKSGCENEITDDPNGDCDNDLLPNAVDDCDDVPKDETTDQFRSGYTLIDTEDAADVCSTSSHVRPDGKLSANSCVYKDTGLCEECQYWYQIVGVDASGNETSLDATYAYPALSRDKEDTTPPDMETDPTATPPPPKPTVKAVTGGGQLLIKFKPLDITNPGPKNEDIQGYILYRYNKNENPDITNPTQDYTNNIARIDDLSKAVHCDTSDQEYICITDVSVINGESYYYKYVAFDYSGNVSEQSNFGKGKPSVSDLPQDANGLWVQPAPADNYSLRITWYAGSSMQKICNDSAGTYTPVTSGCTSKPYADGCACTDNSDCTQDTCSSGACTLSGQSCDIDDDCTADRICAYYVTDSSSTVAGFKLFRSTSQSGLWQLITPPNANSLGYFPKTATVFNDTGLVMGQQYCYKLVTVDTTGAESAGAVTDPCGTPGEDKFAPAAPVGLTAVPGNGSVTIRWSPNPESDLGGYNLYEVTRTTDTSGNTVTTYERVNESRITYPSFTISGLTNGTTYWYAVKAYDQVGNESYPSAAVVAVPSATSSGTKSLSRSVAKGWNLISIPSDPSGGLTDLSRLSGKSLSGDTAYSLDSTGIYSGQALDSGLPASPGQAMWYYVEDEEDALYIQGQLFTGSEMEIPLNTGWNLIGNPFLDTLTWSDSHVTFSADGANYITLNEAVDTGILRFAAIFQGDPSGEGEYNPLDPDGSEVVPAGYGFWLKVDRPITIKLIK